MANIAIPFFLISWGQKTIDSGVASILDATVPLFTILVAHFMLHDDKMNTPKVLGLLVGFAGVVVLMSKDIGAATGSLLGQLAVILACVFYAASSIIARLYTEEIPGIMRSMGPLVSGPRWSCPSLHSSLSHRSRYQLCPSPGSHCCGWASSDRGWRSSCCII